MMQVKDQILDDNKIGPKKPRKDTVSHCFTSLETMTILEMITVTVFGTAILVRPFLCS